MKIKSILPIMVLSLSSFSQSSAMSETPQEMLHRALKAGDFGIKLAEKAIKLGANINIVYKDGGQENSFMLCDFSSHCNETVLMILIDSFVTGHSIEKMFQLLLNSGVDINLQNKHGNTALHHAALCEAKDFIKSLLESGANINIKNKNNQTPLDIAKSEISSLKINLDKLDPYINNFKDVLNLLEIWPEILRKKREKVTQEVNLHLLPEITNLVTQYDVPTIEAEQKENSEAS